MTDQSDLCAASCDLLREADHRIANHLGLIACFVRIQALELGRLSDDELREGAALRMAAILAQLEAVSAVHRLLSGRNPAQAVELSEFLTQICTPLTMAAPRRLRLVQQFQAGCRLSPAQLLPIGQIVAELVTNAFKYAYVGGQAGPVLASCRREGSGDLILDVRDHGVGFPAGFDPNHNGGLGFRLVRTLLNQLNGRLVLDDATPGAAVRLTIPI